MKNNTNNTVSKTVWENMLFLPNETSLVTQGTRYEQEGAGSNYN